MKPEMYDKFLISPGPGHPMEHPAIFHLLERFAKTRSILGICLGMQTIAIHYGGGLINLEHPVHGQVKKVRIIPPILPIFNKFSEQFDAGLYHSWAVDPQNLPEELTLSAVSEDGVIMALSHEKYDVAGVQFHPESIMTPMGAKMMENWSNA